MAVAVATARNKCDGDEQRLGPLLPLCYSKESASIYQLATERKKEIGYSNHSAEGGVVAANFVFARSNNTTTIGSSFPSRFEYVENVHSTERSCGGPQTISRVVPPNPSSFFAEFGTDNGFPERGNSKFSEVQIEETDEARKNAQFVGDQTKLMMLIPGFRCRCFQVHLIPSRRKEFSSRLSRKSCATP